MQELKAIARIDAMATVEQSCAIANDSLNVFFLATCSRTFLWYNLAIVQLNRFVAVLDFCSIAAGQRCLFLQGWQCHDHIHTMTTIQYEMVADTVKNALPSLCLI